MLPRIFAYDDTTIWADRKFSSHMELRRKTTLFAVSKVRIARYVFFMKKNLADSTVLLFSPMLGVTRVDEPSDYRLENLDCLFH